MIKRKIVPDYIYAKKKEKSSFIASILIIDIVGFTRLTRRLMNESIEGSEILHSILQTLFSNSVNVIDRKKGFIAHFEGDGFLAIFPQENSQSHENALAAAIEIVKYFKKNGKITTKFGTVILKIRVALNFGEVFVDYIPKTHLFFVSGSAIDYAKHLLVDCKPNQIIETKIFKNQFQDYYEHFRREKRKNQIAENDGFCKQLVHLDKSDLQSDEDQFEQVDVDFKGEFRDLIACFIDLKSDRFTDSISDILEKVKHYKGFFKDINVFKNEYKLLIYFGAPNSLEKIFNAAIEFTHAILNQFGDSVKLSLTFSKCFIGFLAILDYEEFIAIGSGINLAARLLEQSHWGEILIDHSIYKKMQKKYNTFVEGYHKLKGFSAKINYYKLLEQKEQIETKEKMPFVGRKAEIVDLNQFILPLEKKMFAGICYLEGKAGIGKSFLLQEFQKQNQQKYFWFKLTGNPIIKNSLQPVKECLKHFFYQQNHKQERKGDFQIIFDSFFSTFFVGTVLQEINVIKPALAAFLNLKTTKDFEYLNPQIQFRKKIEAIDSFFLLLSKQKPVIFEIDDAPILDFDTLKWFRNFALKSQNYPIAFISTVRKETENFHFSFYDEPKPFETFVELNRMKKSEIKSLILYFDKNQYIDTEMKNMIYNKSLGNPLFAQQITLYLLEKRKQQDSDVLEVPADIRLIISARIEKLDNGIKKITKVASVIGEIFSFKILTAILSEENLESNLESAIRENIFVKISNNKYKFSHGLIRDTIYQMQMKKEIRKFHAQIANAYIQESNNNENDFDATIAYHYEKAENIEKAIEFYLKATKTARENYYNSNALEYISKLLSYKKILLPQQYIKVLFNKIELLNILGNWKESEELIPIALKQAENLKFLEVKADLLTELAKLKYMKGNLEASLTDLNSAGIIYSEIGNQKGLSFTLEKKAIILMRSQKWQEAEQLFLKKIKSDEKHNDKKGLSSSYLNYAVFLNGRGQIKDSKAFYIRGLKISKEIQDKPSLCTANGNLAIIYMQEKNYTEARNYFEIALKLAIELGEQRSLVFLYGNFGNLFLMEMELEKAAELFEKQYIFAKKLNYPHGIVLSYLNKNNLEMEKENFDKALKYLEKALTIAKQRNIQQDVFTILKSKSRLFFMFDYFKEALMISKEMLKLSKEKNNHYLYCISLQGLGMIYEQLNDWKKSISYFNEAIEEADKYSFSTIRNHCTEKKLQVLYNEKQYKTIENIIEQKKLLSVSHISQIIKYKSEIHLVKDVKSKQYLLSKIKSEIDKMKEEVERLDQKVNLLSIFQEIYDENVFQNEINNLLIESQKISGGSLHFETKKKLKLIQEKVGQYAKRF